MLGSVDTERLRRFCKESFRLYSCLPPEEFPTIPYFRVITMNHASVLDERGIFPVALALWFPLSFPAESREFSRQGG